LPSTGNATSINLYTYLTVLRFHVSNFSGTKIWMGAGAKDDASPDNKTRWKYEQANTTMVTPTCLVAVTMHEPAHCTRTLASLVASDPSHYSYRFVYEAQGTHLIEQFDMSDVFQYWAGTLGAGCFDANFPPTSVVSCP
ncbi:MAG TPA: hypothetical protein VIZ68_04920, partial [Thermoplasmata archaeon]